MFILYTLIFLLICLTILSYYLSDRDILSTPVTLCMAFCGTCCMAVMYADIWMLNLSDMTALVVFVGISSYLLGYFIFFYYKNRKFVARKKCFKEEIYVNSFATYVFVLLEMISVYGSYNYLNEVTSLFLSTDNLIEKVGVFHMVIMDQEIVEKMSIPSKTRFYSWLEDFCHVGAYIYMYILAHDYVFSRKIKWYFIPIILLYLLNSLLTGGRFDTVATFISFAIFIYIFNAKNNNWKMGISLKKFLKYGILLIMLLLFFPMSMLFLGRSDMEISLDTIGDVFEEVMYSLAVYVGAEIKLLDIFVTETYINVNYDDPLGSHTLIGVYRFIANTFNINDWKGISSGDIPYEIVNGHFLGNVYTMFRAYMTDGGILGVMIFSSIMGAIFAYFYYNVRHKCSDRIEVNLIVYSWLYYCVPLSFFSNWFYPLIAPNLVRMILSFFICKILILKREI